MLFPDKSRNALLPSETRYEQLFKDGAFVLSTNTGTNRTDIWVIKGGDNDAEQTEQNKNQLTTGASLSLSVSLPINTSSTVSLSR